jgi:hypothetical protein
VRRFGAATNQPLPRVARWSEALAITRSPRRRCNVATFRQRLPSPGDPLVHGARIQPDLPAQSDDAWNQTQPAELVCARQRHPELGCNLRHREQLSHPIFSLPPNGMTTAEVRAWGATGSAIT